jgi:uncharacterized membrane protein
MSDANPGLSDPKEPISDAVAQNISDIVALETEELEKSSRPQRWLEAVSRKIARPGYLVGVLIFGVGWIVLNLKPWFSRPPFDPPPFAWLQGLLAFIALLTTTIVLIGQGRQIKLSEQRAHLDLQINLLTEQKVSKLIHLIEELRIDLPGVRDRLDVHASQLKKPTDAAQLASALKKKDEPAKSRDDRGSDK